MSLGCRRRFDHHPTDSTFASAAIVIPQDSHIHCRPSAISNAALFNRHKARHVIIFCWETIACTIKQSSCVIRKRAANWQERKGREFLNFLWYDILITSSTLAEILLFLSARFTPLIITYPLLLSSCQKLTRIPIFVERISWDGRTFELRKFSFVLYI